MGLGTASSELKFRNSPVTLSINTDSHYKLKTLIQCLFFHKVGGVSVVRLNAQPSGCSDLTCTWIHIYCVYERQPCFICACLGTLVLFFSSSSFLLCTPFTIKKQTRPSHTWMEKVWHSMRSLYFVTKQYIYKYIYVKINTVYYI